MCSIVASVAVAASDSGNCCDSVYAKLLLVLLPLIMENECDYVYAQLLLIMTAADNDSWMWLWLCWFVAILLLIMAV